MYFSICVPVFNRETTIIRTLESLRVQSFKSFEVIIVDDGSGDNTASVIEQYLMLQNNDERFKYFRKENGGKHSALNVGIAEARGEFFIILDSDDWLVADALERLHELCSMIANDDKFCGVMGRCLDYSTNRMIGDPFNILSDTGITSYFDYHFILAQKQKLQDSFEAIKCSILKKYRFPESTHIKFVPEAYVFDQIGIDYSLLITNQVFKYVEYMQDGMTLNPHFKQDNAAGFLYHYISRIENILVRKKMPYTLKIKLFVLFWWRYWECVSFDSDNHGPRIQTVPAGAYLVKYSIPLISKVFSFKYKV